MCQYILLLLLFLNLPYGLIRFKNHHLLTADSANHHLCPLSIYIWWFLNLHNPVCSWIFTSQSCFYQIQEPLSGVMCWQLCRRIQEPSVPFFNTDGGSWFFTTQKVKHRQCVSETTDRQWLLIMQIPESGHWIHTESGSWNLQVGVGSDSGVSIF